MNWALVIAGAAQVLADAQALVELGQEIGPEIQTAVLLLTQKTTLTAEQRQMDLQSLNAMQAELNADAAETE